MLYIFTLLLFPYYELIFRLFTVCDISVPGLMLTFLFSVSTGAIAAILMRISKSGRVNGIITGAILFIAPIFYLIELFVYRSFNVFYDIETVLNGAGGVLTGFMGDVKRLVLSPYGIIPIILFMLPFLLYIFFLRKIMQKERHKLSDILYFVGIFLFAYLSAILIIRIDEGRFLMYEREYSYQSAVETYGLSTGIRLDIKKLFTRKDADFEIDYADKNDTGVRNKANYSKLLIMPEDISYVKKDLFISVKALNDNVNVENEDMFLSLSYMSDFNDEKGNSGTYEAWSDNENFAYANDYKSYGEAAETMSQMDLGDIGNIENIYDIDVEDETIENIDYGVNAMDFDFEALAENTTGTVHDINEYLSTLTPSNKNKYTGLFEGKNLIFITAEAFSGDIIDKELTPTLYRLANNGIRFTDFYQPAIAGTTGGEYANLFGLIPVNGGKSMKVMTDQSTWITMASRLSELNYYGKAYHNNTYTIYGRDYTHNRLGYSDGFTAMGNGLEEYVSYSGFPESDYEMLKETFELYKDKQPFNIYYMTVSGHGQYGRSINQMSAKNYDRVKDLDYSEIIKCYISNNLELEDGLSYLVSALERENLADDTVIVLCADHFPYGLDNDAALGAMPYLSELYGYDVTNYLQRDHNRLIIWSGCLENMDAIEVSEPTFSLDILPTLLNLFGVKFDSRLYPGRDVFSDAEALIFDGSYDFKTSLGTYIASKGEFIPESEDIDIPEDYVNQIKKLVRNKMNYCKSVISCDYFGTLVP